MNKVYSYLLDEFNLKSADTLVVAVSGGPDSMALLHVLLEIKKSLNIKIVCAHVNHNTGRKGQDEEYEYVKKYCLDSGISFEGMIIEEYSDDNFENEARSKRYDYFEKLIKKYNAKYLFTAHHGDDLIETILMRIVRGSTLRGYSGFSKIVDRGNYKIVRPFIELTKQEIIDYNDKNKVKYFIDETNLEDIHTRNRYRKYIVPSLKKEDINVHTKFYKFSKTLLEYNSYIDREVKKIMSTIYRDNILNIKEFLKLEKIIGMKVIYDILESIYQDDLMLITDQHAELIYSLIISDKANAYVYLPNNFKAIKTYNSLQFLITEAETNSYEIEIIDNVSLPNGHSIKVLNNCTSTGNDVCYLNSSDIKLPLRVRTRTSGDKMSVKNMEGHKKINDIFIDSKIKMSDRDIWPIVVDSNDEIVWVPNLKKSKFDKTKDKNCDIILKYY